MVEMSINCYWIQNESQSPTLAYETTSYLSILLESFTSTKFLPAPGLCSHSSLLREYSSLFSGYLGAFLA